MKPYCSSIPSGKETMSYSSSLVVETGPKRRCLLTEIAGSSFNMVAAESATVAAAAAAAAEMELSVLSSSKCVEMK